METIKKPVQTALALKIFFFIFQFFLSLMETTEEPVQTALTLRTFS